MAYEHAVTYIELAHSKEDTIDKWVTRIESAVAKANCPVQEEEVKAE